MNRSDTIGAIAAALAAAQKAFAPVPKDRQVKTGSYSFQYATLDAIRNATMPALAEQQLAITQAVVPRENGWAIETLLMHASGEWVSNMTPMIVETRDGQRAGNQQMGSAQMYARRYGWTALLALTADEDDDGNRADGNSVERFEDRPHKPGPVGSAASGGDFRLPGPRQFLGSTLPTSDWVGDAKRDGTLDTNRTKGNLKPDVDAVALAAWCKESYAGLDMIPTKPDLIAWWKTNTVMLKAAETKMPAEYERLLAKFDKRMDTVAAKGI